MASWAMSILPGGAHEAVDHYEAAAAMLAENDLFAAPRRELCASWLRVVNWLPSRPRASVTGRTSATEFLKTMTLRLIHVFESRAHAFRDDEVLQENVIRHAIRGAKKGRVVISSSMRPEDEHVVVREIAHEVVARPHDPDAFIYIAADELSDRVIDLMGPEHLTCFGPSERTNGTGRYVRTLHRSGRWRHPCDHGEGHRRRARGAGAGRRARVSAILGDPGAV